METVKVGMREFRENLAGYLESAAPLAIMRHGETLGFYIPAQKRNRKSSTPIYSCGPSWGRGYVR